MRGCAGDAQAQEEMVKAVSMLPDIVPYDDLKVPYRISGTSPSTGVPFASYPAPHSPVTISAV